MNPLTPITLFTSLNIWLQVLIILICAVLLGYIWWRITNKIAAGCSDE